MRVADARARSALECGGLTPPFHEFNPNGASFWAAIAALRGKLAATTQRVAQRLALSGSAVLNLVNVHIS
jgi:hypothetical protein